MVRSGASAGGRTFSMSTTRKSVDTLPPNSFQKMLNSEKRMVRPNFFQVFVDSSSHQDATSA